MQVVSYKDGDFRMVSDADLVAAGYPAGSASYLRRMLSCDPTQRPTVAQAVEWWNSPHVSDWKCVAL